LGCKEESRRFLKKAPQNFFETGPEALKLHGPKVTKFFCFFFSKKKRFLSYGA